MWYSVIIKLNQPLHITQLPHSHITPSVIHLHNPITDWWYTDITSHYTDITVSPPHPSTPHDVPDPWPGWGKSDNHIHNDYILLLIPTQVCQRWRSLARRLNLGCYIPSIERMRGDDSGQLRMVLRMWQATFPDGYTVRGCKNVLAAEVSFQWWSSWGLLSM